MRKMISSEKIRTWVRAAKPWVAGIAILVVLRYTGLLSGISNLGGTTIMKTGAMDYEPAKASRKEVFDYNFSIKDLKGNAIDFNKFKDKVIFLNLWATWCGPCRMEMPSIQTLYSGIADKDNVVFVMLSLDRDSHREKVVQFVESGAYTFPVYMPSGSLPELLQVPSIPTTFIISPDGEVASKNVGAANYDNDKVKKFLEDLKTKR